ESLPENRNGRSDFARENHKNGSKRLKCGIQAVKHSVVGRAPVKRLPVDDAVGVKRRGGARICAPVGDIEVIQDLEIASGGLEAEAGAISGGAAPEVKTVEVAVASQHQASLRIVAFARIAAREVMQHGVAARGSQLE